MPKRATTIKEVFLYKANAKTLMKIPYEFLNLNLSPLSESIYLRICYLSLRDGFCSISIETLSNLLKAKEKTIHKSIVQLSRKNLIFAKLARKDAALLFFPLDFNFIYKIPKKILFNVWEDLKREFPHDLENLKNILLFRGPHGKKFI